MAKRPDISVILLSSRGAIRADFSKNLAAPVFKTQESVDAESSLCDAVRQVVDNQPALGTRTMVMSTVVWSQIVALPYLSIADMEPEELDVALKFETETLSGIEIDEIALAHSNLGRQDDFEQYWVSAIRQADLAEISQFLSSVGCREITITHPAGLSGDPTQKSLLRSIEVWDDLAYVLTQHSMHLEKIKTASTMSFEDSQAILLGVGVGSGDNAFADLDESVEVFDLEDEREFDRWAGRVATNYLKHADSLSAPLIRRIKRIRGTPVRHLVSGVIALAVLGFCLWHWQFMTDHNEMVKLQIIEIQKPAKQKNEHDAAFLAILEKRAEIQLEVSALADDLKRIRFFLDHQHNRISKLLNLLVELRTPDLFIKEINGTEEGMSISGISLNGESAQALAKRLRDQALSLGWIVNAARLDGQEKLTTGGPWDYEILLTDTGPFEFAIQPRKKNIPLLTPNP